MKPSIVQGSGSYLEAFKAKKQAEAAMKHNSQSQPNEPEQAAQQASQGKEELAEVHPNSISL